MSSTENKERLFGNEKERSFIEDSNFRTKEYRCVGSCSCDERRSVNIVRNGLIYITGAVSSFIALEKAKYFFEKECEIQLENECPSYSMIKSDVDSCEKQSSEEISDETYIVENLKSVYHCTGKCVPIDLKYFLSLADSIDKDKNEKKSLKKALKKISKKAQCLRISDSKTISEDDLVHHYSGDLTEEKVKEFFTKRYLSSLCQSKGIRKLPGMKVGDGEGIEFCQAWKGEVKDVDFDPSLNPTLVCKKI